MIRFPSPVHRAGRRPRTGHDSGRWTAANCTVGLPPTRTGHTSARAPRCHLPHTTGAAPVPPDTTACPAAVGNALPPPASPPPAPHQPANKGTPQQQPTALPRREDHRAPIPNPTFRPAGSRPVRAIRNTSTPGPPPRAQSGAHTPGSATLHALIPVALPISNPPTEKTRSLVRPRRPCR